MSAEAYTPVSSIVPYEVLPDTSDGGRGDAKPSLTLLDGGLPDEIEIDRDSSSQLHEWYFQARAKAAEVVKPQGEELKAIQSRVAAWLTTEGPLKDGYVPSPEEYSGESEKPAGDKIASVIEYLRYNAADVVSDIELDATGLFLTSTYEMYESTPPEGEVHPDAEKSFAFVVPARMSRFNEYAREVETAVPALYYVPDELRASLLIGLPPFVIDRYERGEDGARNNLVLAPVFPDMMIDMPSMGEARKAAVLQVNKAVDFAQRRLGAEQVGLGATLPSLTKYGETITNEVVESTTGHAGTIALIFKTLEKARIEGRTSEENVRRIGVLGLGAIGEKIAEIAREKYPEADITVFDKRKKQTERVAETIGAAAADSIEQVLNESDYVLSAVSTPIDIDQLQLEPGALEGKLIIDDSQPGAFNLEQVQKAGATLLWVVGTDKTGNFVRNDYTYGDTLVGREALFGCESEVYVLSRYGRDLEAEGYSPAEVRQKIHEMAIQGPVTAEQVRAIDALFDKYGIQAAPLQAFGQLV